MYFLKSCVLFFFPSKKIFQISPLNLTEWSAVIKFSLPVVLLDETQKAFARSTEEGHSFVQQLPALALMWAVYAGFILRFPLWF